MGKYGGFSDFRLYLCRTRPKKLVWVNSAAFRRHLLILSCITVSPFVVQRSMKILSAFVLPSFIAESIYKIWWFSSGGTQIPYLYNAALSNTFVCILLICSWLYRISISFLVCVLFRLISCLQIFRLEDFAQVFEKESDVATIMIEHLRIRRNLRVISHRFRVFILSTLILVTVSQFLALLLTTEPSSTVNIFTAGELAVCI